MLLSALAVLALAAPLQVRVLEREKPVRVHLDAPQVRCDGKPLPASLDVEVGNRDLKAGSALCTEVRADGEATVKIGDVTRRYPGALRIVVEGGLLKLINEADVEDYLPSVVQAEMSGAKPAALEAQAIVSRTFAVSAKRHGKAGYDLCDLTHCQLYRGRTNESPEARAAVASTKGQVVLVGGVAIKPAYFHAACGGHTSAPRDVFGEEGAGPGVSDVESGAPRCQAFPDFAWEWKVDRVELAKGLGLKVEGGVAIEPLRRDAGGRLLELRSFGKRMSGSEFISRVGRAFGWQTIRSMKLTSEQVDDEVRFKGTGFGHGVGLCQQGARSLADKGVDAKGILKRYFPDSQVRVP